MTEQTDPQVVALETALNKVEVDIARILKESFVVFPDGITLTPQMISNLVVEIRNKSVEVAQTLAYLRRLSSVLKGRLAALQSRFDAAYRAAMSLPDVMAGRDAEARKSRGLAKAQAECGKDLEITASNLNKLTSAVQALDLVYSDLGNARYATSNLVRLHTTQIRMES